MSKDQINEIIDMVQAIAKVITDEIEHSDLIDDDKKKKLAVIEPAVSSIIDQLQVIMNEMEILGSLGSRPRIKRS